MCTSGLIYYCMLWFKNGFYLRVDQKKAIRIWSPHLTLHPYWILESSLLKTDQFQFCTHLLFIRPRSLHSLPLGDTNWLNPCYVDLNFVTLPDQDDCPSRDEDGVGCCWYWRLCWCWSLCWFVLMFILVKVLVLILVLIAKFKEGCVTWGEV